MTLVGHVRGGLGYVGIMAAIIMAALSGSAVADAAATAPGPPEAKEPEKKKRGFWSRVFGRGKDDDEEDDSGDSDTAPDSGASSFDAERDGAVEDLFSNSISSRMFGDSRLMT